MKKLMFVSVAIAAIYSGAVLSCPFMRAFCVSGGSAGYIVGHIDYESTYHGAAPECKSKLSGSDIFSLCKSRHPETVKVEYAKGTDWTPFLFQSTYISSKSLSWVTDVYNRTYTPSS